MVEIFYLLDSLTLYVFIYPLEYTLYLVLFFFR